ncbi:MAG: N-acetylneuraminate synthase family protein [Anaerolineae bacterium]|nr:N-acetylneuraminate synthase family protein [Anaerolineae bacterium]
MIIERNLSPYIIFVEESIAAAVNKIVDNRNTVICAVDAAGVMEGLFTNGDFLRWLVRQQVLDLNQPLAAILNRDFIYAAEDDSPDRIRALLDKVNFVPLLDNQRRLVAIARRRDRSIKIGPFVIDDDSPTFIIAEIGINHNGSLDLAKRLIEHAVEAGADCAKLQMRSLSALYQNRGDPNDASENLGSQYTLDLLTRFNLSQEEMFEAFDYCKSLGIFPLCTAWDLESLEALEAYGLQAYKVASADMTNHELLRALACTGKPLICSTGMSDEEEIVQTAKLLRSLGAQYVLLHCNATYPAPFKDVNLRYMDRLREIGECPVGYSGHERGYHVPVAAVARGAKVIEKHITVDRSMEGNDHKVSLLPDEFRDMVDAIRQLEEALGSGTERRVTPGERINRATLAKSLVINCALEPGEVITEAMIEVRSPGRGLQPNRKHELVGRRAKRRFRPGDFFFPGDLGTDSVQPRPYAFKRPWGIPVRYYDYRTMMEGTNPDFLEFHLSYKDMDLNLHQFFDCTYDLALTVHSPDLFAGDHLLNLAAEDESYRQRSIAEVQRVIEITRELKTYFARATRPFVIISMGGFSRDGLLPASARPSMYARIADSLSKLDADGVELIAQTLPPFPWYFGGQLYLNLFVDPTDTVAFSREYGYRLCFDVSHSKLACNHFHWSFSEFVQYAGSHIAHMHLADARGLDDEGLQIGEGDVDFPALAAQLERLAPHAWFIPEIWQGHENGGEEFWIALERLEKWFGEGYGGPMSHVQ